MFALIQKRAGFTNTTILDYLWWLISPQQHCIARNAHNCTKNILKTYTLCFALCPSRNNKYATKSKHNSILAQHKRKWNKLFLNQENQCYQHHSQNILYKWYEPITLHYLISECWSLFERYGAPEEFSSHGGPQFTSTKFQSFLKDWGVHNGTSSAGYPQSNEHAELAVKASKRIIIDNISNHSDLNNNKAAQAILLYCNTPLPEFVFTDS